MNIRLYNARILTLANGFEIERGEVHVKGSLISYVGEEKENRGKLGQGNQLHGQFTDAGI